MTKTKTLKPVAITERYEIILVNTKDGVADYKIDYSDTYGIKQVEISSVGDPPNSWLYNDGEKIRGIALSGDLENEINKLPLHVRKVMGIIHKTK